MRTTGKMRNAGKHNSKLLKVKESFEKSEGIINVEIQLLDTIFAFKHLLAVEMFCSIHQLLLDLYFIRNPQEPYASLIPRQIFSGRLKTELFVRGS